MRRPTILLIVLSVLAVQSACGGASKPRAASVATGTTAGSTTVTSTTTGPAAPATPLGDALRAVTAGPAARAQFTFGDEAALRRLAHAPASVAQLGTTQLDQRWFGLVGVGASAFLDSAPRLPRAVGIDLFQADRSIALGTPPRLATRLDGARLEPARIAAALRRLGARPTTVAGHPALALGAEGSTHIDGQLGQLGLLTALDRAVLAPAMLVTGGFAEPVGEALGAGGRSLAAVPDYALAARCLGDPVAAMIIPTRMGLVAIGVDRPPPHPAHVVETVCLAGSAARLDAAQRALSAAFPAGRPRDPALRARVAAARVTRAPGVLRAALTLARDAPATVVFSLELSGELGPLLGAACPRSRSTSSGACAR